MSTLRLFQVIVLVFLCWRTRRVCCEDTQFYIVDNNGEITGGGTLNLNNTLFIQCLCLTNTTTCSNPVTKSGLVQQFILCNSNIVDVEPGNVTYRKSSDIATQCGRKDSRTIIYFFQRNACPNQCLVISFPSIDITLTEIDFIKASKQCKDFQIRLTNFTSTEISKIQQSTTITLTATTPVSMSSSNLTVILTCSILGVIVAFIIVFMVVILRRKNSKENSLVNSEKYNPLVRGLVQGDAYSQPGQGYENNGDFHSYAQMQHSSYVNGDKLGIPTPGAYANLDYSLPNQTVEENIHDGDPRENNSLQLINDGSAAYIEIIGDTVSYPVKIPEYLSLYDKPETTYGNTYSSPYAPVINGPKTSVDNGHLYLSLKLSDSDSVYIDAFSVKGTKN